MGLKRQSQELTERPRTLLAIWTNAGREAGPWFPRANQSGPVSFQSIFEEFSSVSGSYCEQVGAGAVWALSLRNYGGQTVNAIQARLY